MIKKNVPGLFGVIVLAIFLAAGCAAGPNAAGQWRVLPLKSHEEFQAGKTGGEALQHLHSLARCADHPDIIYLAHDCSQFWRSRDNGLTWRKCPGRNCPLNATQSIEVDPVNPDIVLATLSSTFNYLVKDFEGLYRSTDGGDSWQWVLPAETAQQRFCQHNLAWDPTTRTPRGAQRWYAGFAGQALFRSEDGGLTWTKAADLQAHAPLYALRTHPADGQTVYLASARGLFVSAARGADLKPLGDLPAGEVTAVAIDPQTPRRLYAVLKGRGLYRSENGGATFTLLRAFNAIWVSLNPSYPEVLYLVGQGNESLVSDDGGRTWDPVVETVPPPGWPTNQWQAHFGGEFSGVLPDPRDPRGAFGYSRARLWRTADGGRHWTDSSTLFTGYAFGWGPGSVAFDPVDPRHFTMFCYDAGPVVTETGGDWFARSGVPEEWRGRKVRWTGAYLGQYQPVAGSKIMVATVGYYHESKLMRTTDDGQTWEIVGDQVGNYYFVGFHPREPNLVFSENLRSTDAGASWQPIPYLVEHHAVIMGLCRAQPDTLYALALSEKEIHRSDDRGRSWRLYAKVDWRFSGLSSQPTFAVDPRDPDKVYALSRRRDLASFDGRQWRDLGVLPLAGGEKFHNFVSQVMFDPRRPEVLYATTAIAGLPYVFRSVDGGQSWEDVTRNLPRLGHGGLEVSPLTGEVLHGGVFGTWVLPPPYEGPAPLYNKAVRPAEK